VTVASPGLAGAKTSVTSAEQRVEWEPRLSEQSWWQTRQSREALVERLLGLFTDSSAGRSRDKTRRRGLTKLLDWLQRQPGDTWQDRWLASGADSAGFGWADLLLSERVPARPHHRDELCCGLELLVAGQVIRPGYAWLLRQRQALMLAEAREAIDPDGFQNLDPYADHAAGWAKSDALNKLTWIVIRKGGLIGDITVGDCVELTTALQEHHFRGSAGRPLFYAIRVDPAQLPRLEEIHANLVDRLEEAKEQGWLGEVAAIETTMAAAAQKLEAMRAIRNAAVHLGMPDMRSAAGRASAD
jgi:hypothetical protein